MVGSVDIKAWVVLLVGVVSAAVAAAIVGVALDTGMARAATPTRATIEATQFTVQNGQVGEAFAVCPGTSVPWVAASSRVVWLAADFGWLRAARWTARG